MSIGISGRILNAIQSLYDNVQCTVRVNELFSHYSYSLLLSCYDIYCFSLWQIVLIPHTNVVAHCLHRLVAGNIHENIVSCSLKCMKVHILH